MQMPAKGHTFLSSKCKYSRFWRSKKQTIIGHAALHADSNVHLAGAKRQKYQNVKNLRSCKATAVAIVAEGG